MGHIERQGEWNEGAWNDYPRPHADLREAIERLERAGELRRIRGADWKLEMGALAEIIYREESPPAILFEDDADYARGSRFVQEALSRGVYMHPKHNMFLSLAHTAADIDFALSVTDEAFKIVARL